MAIAETALQIAQNNEQAAKEAYIANPTPANEEAWDDAIVALAIAEASYDTARAAYIDCVLDSLGDPIEDPLNGTISILE